MLHGSNKNPSEEYVIGTVSEIAHMPKSNRAPLTESSRIPIAIQRTVRVNGPIERAPPRQTARDDAGARTL